MEYTATETTWFIAYGLSDEPHTGVLSAGLSLSTGQPTLDTFDNRSDWAVALSSMVGAQTFYAEHDDVDYVGLDGLMYNTSVDVELYDEADTRTVVNLHRSLNNKE